MRPPGGVYLCAFESRLVRIWVTRAASPDTTGSRLVTLERESLALGLELWAQQLAYVLDQTDKVQCAAFELRPDGAEACEIQQVLGQVGQPPGVAPGEVQQLPLTPGQRADVPLQHQLQGHDDRRQWGPELVGDLRDELGLPAVHLLEVTILRFERGLLTLQVCLQTLTWVQPSPRVGRLIEDGRVLARLPASARSSGAYLLHGFFPHFLLRLSGGPRRIWVPRPVSRPAPRRCRTVATTSPSSSGPTTSWMAVIRSEAREEDATAQPRSTLGLPG